jgi:hypothetical protein
MVSIFLNHWRDSLLPFCKNVNLHQAEHDGYYQIVYDDDTKRLRYQIRSKATNLLKRNMRMEDPNIIEISKRRKYFNSDEDQIIRAKVAEKGEKCWDELGSILNRNQKQIRERYNHYLKKPLKEDIWSFEEDQIIMFLMQGSLRGKWFQMESYLPGRNQVQIKNRWKRFLYLKEHPIQPAHFDIEPSVLFDHFQQQSTVQHFQVPNFISAQIRKNIIQPSLVLFYEGGQIPSDYSSEDPIVSDNHEDQFQRKYEMKDNHSLQYESTATFLISINGNKSN